MKTKKGSFVRFSHSISALMLIPITALMVFCCDGRQNTSAKNETSAPDKIDFFEETGPKTLRLYQTDYTVIDYYEKWIPVLFIENNYQAIEDHIQSLLDADNESKAFELYTLYDVLGKVTQDKHIELMQNVLDEWCRTNPDSPIPWLVRGTFFISYAWHIRGSGYARTVPKDAWPKFRSKLELA